MKKSELSITEYALTYKDITCIGVDWEKQVFVFLINGIEHLYKQQEEISCSADTDHIRCVIEEFIEKRKEELFKNEFFCNNTDEFYRVIFFEKNDSIVGHTLAPKEWSDDVLYDRINSYNNSNEGKIAICKTFPKNSYIGYLFEKMTEKKNFNKEAIQDAINALEEAKDLIYSLENL